MALIVLPASSFDDDPTSFQVALHIRLFIDVDDLLDLRFINQKSHLLPPVFYHRVRKGAIRKETP